MCHCGGLDGRIVRGWFDFLGPVKVGEMGVFSIANDFCKESILLLCCCVVTPCKMMLLTSLARSDASCLSVL